MIALGAINAQGQTSYYVVPFDSTSSPTFISATVASGIANPSPRCSINPVDSVCLMSFNLANVPNGVLAGPFNDAQIQDVLKDSLWTPLPPPVTGEDRIRADRSIGLDILNEIQAAIRQEYIDGTLNDNQYTAVAGDDDFQSVAVVLLAGNLEMSSLVLQGWSPQVWIPDATVANLIVKLDAYVDALNGTAFMP